MKLIITTTLSILTTLNLALASENTEAPDNARFRQDVWADVQNLASALDQLERAQASTVSLPVQSVDIGSGNYYVPESLMIVDGELAVDSINSATGYEPARSPRVITSYVQVVRPPAQPLLTPEILELNKKIDRLVEALQSSLPVILVSYLEKRASSAELFKRHPYRFLPKQDDHHSRTEIYDSLALLVNTFKLIDHRLRNTQSTRDTSSLIAERVFRLMNEKWSAEIESLKILAAEHQSLPRDLFSPEEHAFVREIYSKASSNREAVAVVDETVDMILHGFVRMARGHGRIVNFGPKFAKDSSCSGPLLY